MKRIPFLVLAALAAASAPAEAPYWFAGDDAAVFPLVTRDFHETWLRDRLSVGIGPSYSTLTDAKRPRDKAGRKTFVGFIYKLDDEDEIGLVPVVSYWAADYVRISLTWDAVRGKTRNYNTSNQHSDGSVVAHGPAFLAEGLLPVQNEEFFLHAGVGLAWEFGDFEEASWWHLGYSSAAAWRAAGSPSRPAGGHWREIHVDDALGAIFAAGVSWRPLERLELDFSLRHVWLEPDCKYGYRDARGFDVHSKGEFTLDHLTAALTVSYVF